jgi:hypothetical protein
MSDLDNNHRHVGHGTAREGQELTQRTTPDIGSGLFRNKHYS